MKTISCSLSWSILALLIAAPSAALAEKPMTGAEMQHALAGKRFDLACVDGTRGSGRYGAGVVQAAYTRPSAREDGGASDTDRASVRAQGQEICLNWQKLNGGGEGCYSITEKAAGAYRLATPNGGWCDITLTR